MILYTSLLKSSLMSSGYHGLITLLSYISWMSIPQRKFFLTVCRCQSTCGVFIDDAFMDFEISNSDAVVVNGEPIP